jgi:hypothetical protein
MSMPVIIDASGDTQTCPFCRAIARAGSPLCPACGRIASIVPPGTAPFDEPHTLPPASAIAPTISADSGWLTDLLNDMEARYGIEVSPQQAVTYLIPRILLGARDGLVELS